MRLSYYEFKILLDDDSVAFHAYIANQKSYRIVYDLNNTYYGLFKKIKNGDLLIKYYDNEKFSTGEDTSYRIFEINSNDAIENINSFKEKCEEIYNFKAYFELSNLQPQLGFIFDGPDYSLADGMSPDAFLNASEFQNKMYKTLKVANNIDFGDAFIEQPKAGSIDLNVHTTKVPNFTDLKRFLESITAKNMDRRFLSDDYQDSKVYKKVVKQLLELENFDNLKAFSFKLGNDEIKFSESILNYLFIEGANLYGESVAYNNARIRHIINLKNSDISSLVIDTASYGTINCHFEFDYDKVNRFNRNLGKQISVSGIQSSERTIELENFNILDETI